APRPREDAFSGMKNGEWRRRTPIRGSSSPPLPSEDVRRRPTLPHPPECSTIGAIELSFRVRNGTGRFLDAMTAVTQRDPTSPHATTLRRRRGCSSRTAQWTQTHTVNNTHKESVVVSHQPLVPVSSSHYCASTSGLSTQSSTGGLSHHKGARISQIGRAHV